MAFSLAPLLLVLLSAPLQEPNAKPTSGEVRLLREQLADALIATREAHGDLSAPSVVKALKPWMNAAVRRSPEALFAVLREGPLFGKQATSHQHHEFSSEGWELRYLVATPKLAAGARAPVLLDPGHSLSGAGGAWSDGEREREALGASAQAEGTALAQAFVVRSEILERAVALARTAPPHEERIALAFDDLLTDLASRHPVDPDRIYLVGTGETASYGWYLLRARPGRWAGLLALGARATWAQRAIANALPVPVYAAHLQGDPQQPLAEHRTACNALEKLGGRVRFVEVDAAEPGGAYGKLADGLAWIAQQGPRTSFPRTLDHGFSTLLNPRAAWIRVDAMGKESDGFGRSHPTARVQATVTGQQIQLRTENVGKLSLSLAPELLDLALPVVVEWNGTRVFEGIVAPDLATALRQTLMSGDWRSCGLAELSLEAPQP